MKTMHFLKRIENVLWYVKDNCKLRLALEVDR